MLPRAFGLASDLVVVDLQIREALLQFSASRYAADRRRGVLHAERAEIMREQRLCKWGHLTITRAV